MWKGYHLSLGSKWTGYLFFQNQYVKGKGWTWGESPHPPNQVYWYQYAVQGEHAMTKWSIHNAKYTFKQQAQDTQWYTGYPKEKPEISTLFFYFLFVNLVCWPLFFSENDHESWFKGSINLFSCFVFPCRSCDNTLVDWTSTFHSNFFLFPCICTHNLWKRQRGKFLLWPTSGKQKLKTSKASIFLFPAPHPPQKK